MLKLFDIYLTSVLACLILVGMLYPIQESTISPAGTDKFIHLAAFSSLVFPLTLSGRLGKFPLFIFASTFGAMIEIIQPLFGRQADFFDWVFDVIGVSIGIKFALLGRWLIYKQW